MCKNNHGNYSNDKPCGLNHVVYGCKITDIKLVVTYFVDRVRMLCCNFFYVHPTHRTTNDHWTVARAVHQERKVRLAGNVKCLSYHHLQSTYTQDHIITGTYYVFIVLYWLYLLVRPSSITINFMSPLCTHAVCLQLTKTNGAML